MSFGLVEDVEEWLVGLAIRPCGLRTDGIPGVGRCLEVIVHLAGTKAISKDRRRAFE